MEAMNDDAIVTSSAHLKRPWYSFLFFVVLSLTHTHTHTHTHTLSLSLSLSLSPSPTVSSQSYSAMFETEQAQHRGLRIKQAHFPSSLLAFGVCVCVCLSVTRRALVTCDSSVFGQQRLCI